MPGAPSGVTAIGIDPGQPDRLLAGGRRGFARSTDGGKTWENVGPVHGRLLGFHFDRTSPAGRRVCFAATDQAVFHSDDSGATWHETSARPGAGAVLNFAGASSEAAKTCVLYCSVAGQTQGEKVAGGIYRSDDRARRGCARWARESTSPGGRDGRGTNFSLPAMRIRRGSTQRVPTTARSSAATTAAQHWRDTLFTSMTSPGFNVGPSYLIDEKGGSTDNISGSGINPADPDHVVVTDWMSCYITRDGGKTWAAAHTQ